MASSSLILPIFLLVLIDVFAVWSMAILQTKNGFQTGVDTIRDYPPFMLAGYNAPLITKYTGIGPLDYFLATIQIVFSFVFDGASPALTLFSFYFGGQCVPILAVMLAEGYREGNKGRLVSLSTLFLMAFQFFGFGIIMPLYCILYLLTSPTTASSLRITDVDSLGTLIPSIITGFIIPSVVISLPWLYTATHHQQLVAAWQFLPILVLLSQHYFKLIGGANKNNSSTRKTVYCPRKLYTFSIACATIIQVTTFGIITVSSIAPHTLPVYLRGLSLKDLFVPQPFWSAEKMRDMAHGAHSIFLYDLYAGSAAGIVLAATVYARSSGRKPVGKSSLAWEVMQASLLAGFGGVIVAFLRRRDEEAIEAEKKTD